MSCVGWRRIVTRATHTIESTSSALALAGLRVHFETFGCQMNQLDSEVALGSLIDHGCQPAADADDADVILFNTCAVRQHSEDRVASRIGALKHAARERPELIIGMIGCQAQRDGEDLLRRFPHLRVVAGTRSFMRLPQLLRKAIDAPDEQLMDLDTELDVQFNRRVGVRPDPFRAQITIQRGCDHRCTYCIVPATRGRQVDVEPEQILDEAKRLVDDGVIDITLLGQNVDSYGRRLSPRFRSSLADLLYEMDRDLGPRGLRRVFFVTSHPSDLHFEVIEAMRDCETVCEYLHLPAQSGSDSQLRAMRRGYTFDKYIEIVERARSIVPGLSIASDFIVGFPGETDADFAKSVELVERVGFSQAYIFKYSPRPTTRSAEVMTDDVPIAVKKHRNNHLLAVQKANVHKQLLSRIGTTIPVLCEGTSKRDAGRLHGRTPGHQIVVWPDDGTPVGRIVPVRIVDATQIVMVGERPGPDATA
jgi:tRNA-2-methylthio-N6-dimethylallyladenosine synthase